MLHIQHLVKIKQKLLAFHLYLNYFAMTMRKYNCCILPGIFPGTRLNADKTDLSEILPEEVEEEVKAAAEISMGTEVL